MKVETDRFQRIDASGIREFFAELGVREGEELMGHLVAHTESDWAHRYSIITKFQTYSFE